MLKPKKYKAPMLNSGIKKFTKKKLYDSGDWATFRFRFLHANPKCYCCGEPSKVIDHVKTHRGDDSLFWNNHNMIPMCKKCHATVTNKFDREGEQNLEGKLNWINDMRVRTGTYISVKVISINYQGR